MTRIQDVTTGSAYYATFDDWHYCHECPRGEQWWVDDDPNETFERVVLRDGEQGRAKCPRHGCEMYSCEEMERRAEPVEDF